MPHEIRSVSLPTLSIGQQHISVPKGARVLGMYVATPAQPFQQPLVFLSIIADWSEPPAMLAIQIVGPHAPINNANLLDYIGTVGAGAFIFYVFRQVDPMERLVLRGMFG